MIDLRRFMKKGSTECHDMLEPYTFAPSEEGDGWHLEAADTSSAGQQLCRGTHEKLHPLVRTADMGFSSHYPLSFSADDFLHPLLTQLSMVRNLRAAGQQGAKLCLVVRRDDFALGNATNPWPEVFADFREQIRGHVGDAEYRMFHPGFTTSTAVHQAAYDVALMDAWQSAFSYHNMFCCGIPSVELRGTAQDWNTFKETAASVIDQMAMHVLAPGWPERLRETINNVADSATGKLTPEAAQQFWCDFYRWRTHSGGAGIDGWINLFFPLKIVQGDTAVICDSVEQMFGKDTFGRTRGVTTFPGGCNSAPVTCSDRGGAAHHLKYVAGMVGVSQATDGTISPAFGWSVFSRPDDGTPLEGFSLVQRRGVSIKTPWCSTSGLFDLSLNVEKLFKDTIKSCSWGDVEDRRYILVERETGDPVDLSLCVQDLKCTKLHIKEIN